MFVSAEGTSVPLLSFQDVIPRASSHFPSPLSTFPFVPSDYNQWTPTVPDGATEPHQLLLLRAHCILHC